MAIQNATPTLWAKMILRAYNTLTVFNGPGVISREYEGTIQSEGDSVKIVSIGDPEVRKYKKDTDITGPDAIVDASQTLIIDQADYLNWAIDGIDLAQVTIDVMEEASRRSAYKLRKEADTFTAKLWEKIDVSTEQKLTEVKRSTFTEGRSAVYDLIVEAGVKLDQTDTPEDGRFVVLNPASVGALQKDLRFTGYGTAPNRSQRRESRRVQLVPVEPGAVRNQKIQMHRGSPDRVDVRGPDPELRNVPSRKKDRRDRAQGSACLRRQGAASVVPGPRPHRRRLKERGHYGYRKTQSIRSAGNRV